ncbi:MAG: inner membrane CreD family protein [Planctomycetes bacterium]|nr:inner membrane CreD family protein [Planctomycetota bacterium]
MNAKKLAVIVMIWVLAAMAWLFLGHTVKQRTDDSKKHLGEDVTKLWGSPQTQREPTVCQGVDSKAAPIVPIARSDVTVDINTQQRKRGLQWFAVYDVDFSGSYTIANETDQAQRYVVQFAPPESEAEFSRQQVTVDGQALPEWTTRVETVVPAGASSVVTFSYASTGTESWRYSLPKGGMIRDLKLTLRINHPGYDFDPNDAAAGPPNQRSMTPDAEGKYTLVWTKKLVSNARDILVRMPQREQPGTLVQLICRFAPVCLFFFFVIMVTIQIIKSLPLHPMHYLFLSAAFFAFHLLLAYMVGHVELHRSFWISAGVSVLLAVMYLWMVAGPKAGILYAGLSQLVYLVLFSYAFFMKEFTGLTITIASIITLAVLMVLTAKVRWGETMPELERRPVQPPLVPIRAAGSQAAQMPPDEEPPGFMGESNGKNGKSPQA